MRHKNIRTGERLGSINVLSRYQQGAIQRRRSGDRAALRRTHRHPMRRHRINLILKPRNELRGIGLRPGHHLLAEHVGGVGGEFVLPPPFEDGALTGQADDAVAVVDPLDELDVLVAGNQGEFECCLLYTSPSPRDKRQSRMPSSA